MYTDACMKRWHEHTIENSCTLSAGCIRKHVLSISFMRYPFRVHTLHVRCYVLKVHLIPYMYMLHCAAYGP